MHMYTYINYQLIIYNCISATIHMQQQFPDIQRIYYLMSFSMFNNFDIQLLCSYKQFIESTIIELGEDWRIESGLLSQEIMSIINNNISASADSVMSERLQFNIFNQFLLPFLKNKIGKQKEVCQLTDSFIQEDYSTQLNNHFKINEKIINSLTFKTLSLGFCIKAIDTWMKCFSQLNENNNPEPQLKPVGILEKYNQNHPVFLKMGKMGQRSSIGTSTIRQNLSNIDLGSCQHSNSENQWNKDKQQNVIKEKKWVFLKDLSVFSQIELNGICHTLKKSKSKKIQVISNFAVSISQINTGFKRIRVLSINNEFYRNAFIVWLIFNIKLFFSITFDQYLIYFKNLVHWEPTLEAPLKKFFNIIQNLWNHLLKDYSVALHDDIEVLKNLIDRVRSDFSKDWQIKQEQICKKLWN